MLITFSGLDGAGKSTLIERLKARLEGRNEEVSVFHMYYDMGLFACLRFIRGKVFGGANGQIRPGGRRTHAPRDPAPGKRFRAMASRAQRAIVWNKSLRLCVYPIDLLIFLFYRLYIEKVKKRVLIMDRYFYDTLVDVADGRRRWSGARLLSLFTPTPSVPVYLDISPEEAHVRCQGEYSVEYLRRRRLSYQQVLPKVRRLVVLSTVGDIDDTLLALEKIVLERMAAR